MAAQGAYQRTTYQGYTVDKRTRSALEWVDRHVHKRIGKHIRMTQGSYNRGGVSASAGTHDGGGVIDLAVTGFTHREIYLINRWMRRAGFASWVRPYLPGVWPMHVHAVLMGHKNAAPLAKSQMRAYLAHRDGLAGNRWDGSWRPKQRRTWSHRRKKPIKH